jgi:hypothetical protein
MSIRITQAIITDKRLGLRIVNTLRKVEHFAQLPRGLTHAIWNDARTMTDPCAGLEELADR